MLRQIPDQSYLASVLDYDASSGLLTWKARDASQMRNWRRFNKECAGKLAGALFKQQSGRKYLVVGVDGGLFYAHRIIWKMVTGNDPPAIIDHCDNDGLNNAWNNLRTSDHSTNGQNSKLRHDNKIGYKGVRRTKAKGERFMARIVIHGKTIHLGSFATADEASRARAMAAEKLHGAFARNE